MANTAKKPEVQAAAVTMNQVVADIISRANAAGNTADQLARQAAAKAVAADYLGEKNKAERIAAIQKLYAAECTHPTVKASFNAAVVVLVNAETVKIAVSGKTEKFSPKVDETGKDAGTLTTLKLDTPDILAKGETPEKGKAVVTLTPEQAVEQLQGNMLKAVATATREELGTGRAKGAGRPAKVTPIRAPFMQELAAAMKDDALCLNICGMFAIAAKNTPSILATAKRICEDAGYEVTKSAKRVPAAK